jgi:hypothetical protein
MCGRRKIVRTTPTEAQTQKAVLEVLALRGIWAARINTGAGFVDGRPIQHHGFGTGCADILAFPVRRRVFFKGSTCGHELIIERIVPTWLEIKAPGRKASAAQVQFQKHVEAIGHKYLLVDNVDQIISWIQTL